MEQFNKKKIIECDSSTLPFETSEIHRYLKKVDGWSLKSNDKKIYFLEKKYFFKDFIKSQKFVNQIGIIAELVSHHPDINFGWGYAKIKIFTHAIKGLSEGDFILAAKIDQLN